MNHNVGPTIGGGPTPARRIRVNLAIKPTRVAARQDQFGDLPEIEPSKILPSVGKGQTI